MQRTEALKHMVSELGLKVSTARGKIQEATLNPDKPIKVGYKGSTAIVAHRIADTGVQWDFTFR